jgi:hypothetical protein
MLARVSHVAVFVMVTGCFLAAGAQIASAQALCPEVEIRPFSETDVPAFATGFPRDPQTITVETDLSAFSPEGTWRMPNPGRPAPDGLALEGVSFTRNTEPELGANLRTIDVVVDLRAWGSLVTDLELVVVDGERSLRLGAFKDVTLRCQATRVSRTFSITDTDFASFFVGGRPPTLRVKRTTRADGC